MTFKQIVRPTFWKAIIPLGFSVIFYYIAVDYGFTEGYRKSGFFGEIYNILLDSLGSSLSYLENIIGDSFLFILFIFFYVVIGFIVELIKGKTKTVISSKQDSIHWQKNDWKIFLIPVVLAVLVVAGIVLWAYNSG